MAEWFAAPSFLSFTSPPTLPLSSSLEPPQSNKRNLQPQGHSLPAPFQPSHQNHNHSDGRRPDTKQHVKDAILVGPSINNNHPTKTNHIDRESERWHSQTNTPKQQEVNVLQWHWTDVPVATKSSSSTTGLQIRLGFNAGIGCPRRFPVESSPLGQIGVHDDGGIFQSLCSPNSSRDTPPWSGIC